MEYYGVIKEMLELIKGSGLSIYEFREKVSKHYLKIEYFPEAFIYNEIIRNNKPNDWTAGRFILYIYNNLELVERSEKLKKLKNGSL